MIAILFENISKFSTWLYIQADRANSSILKKEMFLNTKSKYLFSPKYFFEL